MARTPPWARRRDRCPNCLANLPDDRAAVCDRCGYQLRLPRTSVAGLVVIVIAFGCLLVSAFANWIFPWPPRPFGWRIPIVDTSTPTDLFWVGAVLAVLGGVATLAGAYAVRRRSDRAISRGSA